MAVSATDEAEWVKASSQSAPQLIPAGEEVTVPEPTPAFVTVKTRLGASNEADTDLMSSTKTEQVVGVGLEVQPVQLVKVASPWGSAVRVTVVLDAYESEQSTSGQSIELPSSPLTSPVTRPRSEAGPMTETLRLSVGPLPELNAWLEPSTNPGRSTSSRKAVSAVERVDPRGSAVIDPRTHTSSLP